MNNTGTEETKITQKEKISQALERLNDLKDRGNYLMEMLQEGVAGIRKEKIPDAPPTSTIVLSLWNSLPDAINENVAAINSIFSELEDRFLG